MTFDDVDAFAMSLRGVTVGARWGNRTWLVKAKGFIWQRPLGKADIKRFGDEKPPSGPILGVMVENLDAKDALLAMELPGFFTIEHFKNYPALLIALDKARVKDVRAVILDAYRLRAPAHAAAPRRRAPSSKRRTTRSNR
jgi:hypothetical protein